MKKKTLLKLEKRFLALPLHHIDTSIIIEPSTTEAGRECRKYLQIVGYKYRGKFSLPVLGELLLEIFPLQTAKERYVALDVITGWVENKNIKFYVPKNIGEIVNKIKSTDSRIKETDAHILACAIEDKAQTLVTLDEDLIHNESIEREFKIKIKHPKELI